MSRDFFAEATVEVTGKNEYLLGVDSTFGDIMKNDAVFAVLANAMGGAMGASAGEGSIDKEMLTMVAHETVRNMLAPYLIKAVPDAVAANAILDQMDAAMKAVQ